MTSFKGLIYRAEVIHCNNSYLYIWNSVLICLVEHFTDAPSSPQQGLQQSICLARHVRALQDPPALVLRTLPQIKEENSRTELTQCRAYAPACNPSQSKLVTSNMQTALRSIRNSVSGRLLGVEKQVVCTPCRCSLPCARGGCIRGVVRHQNELLASFPFGTLCALLPFQWHLHK